MAAWLKATGVKEGDPVLALEPTEYAGWSDRVPEMDASIGQVCTISHINKAHSQIKLDDGYFWPFYALIPLNK